MHAYDAAIAARKQALELHRCPAHLKALRDVEKAKVRHFEQLKYDPLKAQAAKVRWLRDVFFLSFS